MTALLFVICTGPGKEISYFLRSLQAAQAGRRPNRLLLDWRHVISNQEIRQAIWFSYLRNTILGLRMAPAEGLRNFEEGKTELKKIQERIQTETPLGETPLGGTLLGEAPSEETPSEETPSEETPSEETPSEETPLRETPSEETPLEGTLSEETSLEENPLKENPLEENPLEEIQEGIRLNKYLSEAGVCSRREADRLIQEGQITVDGHLAKLGMKIPPGACVRVRGTLVEPEQERILLAFHKPAGIVCTAEKREKKNVIDYLQYPRRIFPIGRLDKDSTGLLLLTNDGELVNKIMRAGNYHEKEYLVRVDRPITDAFCRKMAAGVPILDTVTRKCRVEAMGEREFRIVLTQGLNRQIRRMCEALGYRVTALTRVRIMNIELGGLKEGTYRSVEGKELEELERLLASSSSLPAKMRRLRTRDGEVEG